MLPEKDRRRLRAIIKRELEKLDASMEGMRETARPVSPDCSIGRLSRMDSMLTKGTADHLLANASRRRALLKSQLEKINRPEYGLCARCREPIPIERLKAVPDAVMCVPCLESIRKR